MATLRTPVKYSDFLMDKVNKTLYMVLHEETHKVWVIKDGGGTAPFQMAKNVINLGYIKVDKATAEILYKQEPEAKTEELKNE